VCSGDGKGTSVTGIAVRRKVGADESESWYVYLAVSRETGTILGKNLV
jgi:hypothetical protein